MVNILFFPHLTISMTIQKCISDSLKIDDAINCKTSMVFCGLACRTSIFPSLLLTLLTLFLSHFLLLFFASSGHSGFLFYLQYCGLVMLQHQLYSTLFMAGIVSYILKTILLTETMVSSATFVPSIPPIA